MRALLIFALCAVAASAQPAFEAEASADKDAYAYGETITVTYTLRNEGAETATVWAGSTCYPLLGFAPLPAPLLPEACSLAEEPVSIAGGGAFVATWRLDPAHLGIPESDGKQRVTPDLSGPCGVGDGFMDYEATHAFSCDLRATVTFTAPRFLGGILELSYALADADSVASLKEVYQAVVTDSTRFGTTPERVAETWQIGGTVLSDAVAALDANGVIDRAQARRIVEPERQFVVATEGAPGAVRLTPPAPNPTSDRATVAVRLAQTSDATVDVIDLLGRRLAVLHDGPLAAGADHTFTVSGAGLPAGVYVVRVLADGVRQSHRLVVAR